MDEAKRERDRRHDKKRRRSKPWRRLYKTERWQLLRAEQLTAQPLCERCLAMHPPALTPASVVHHEIKHEGNEAIFFDASTLRSSCKRCHDADEQQIEARGYSTATGADGFPTDPKHPFNRD